MSLPPSSASSASSSVGKNKENAIKVMLVDDSAVVRGMMSRILDAQPDIRIVASVANGEQAVAAIRKAAPEVLLLDVEMPIMDGMTALPKLLSASPKTKIVMCSTLTIRNAEITMKALRMGATECLAKPTNSVAINSAEEFQQQLVTLVRGLGRLNRPSGMAPATVTNTAAPVILPKEIEERSAPATPYELNTNPNAYKGKPDILAIGSSTGGPQALFEVVKSFKNFDIPIILTQHMPATFTAILAQHIETQTGVPSVEAAEGMDLQRGRVHIAPGGKHMLLKRSGIQTYLTLNDGPAENFCKPSVDPMLRSAIEIYGQKILMVMLTGMGADGLPSSRQLVEANGRVVAQDEASSVVWGMPGAVAVNGLCANVLPLQKIGPWVRKEIMGSGI